MPSSRSLSGSKKLKVLKYLGLSLSGGKQDKTCIALLEYYPDQDKVFLVRLHDRIRSNESLSADSKIHNLIEELPGKIETVAFDVPLKLPKCLRCRLKCPGYEECDQDEIQWMWKEYRKKNKIKKPKKLFTPYTERCVEFYIANFLEEDFHPPHAMGSNLAPLTARAHFISRRLKTKNIEVFPKVSLWRIGRSLKIQKSHLRFHKHAVSGHESRQAILEKLIEKEIAFLYEQDVNLMIESAQAFDAFLCAFTAVLKWKGLTDDRPRNFPRQESWIEMPKQQLNWKL